MKTLQVQVYIEHWFHYIQGGKFRESLTFFVWSEVALYKYLFADGLLYLLEWANEGKLQKWILVQLILIVVENCLVFYLSVESYIIRWFVHDFLEYATLEYTNLRKIFEKFISIP